MIQFFRRFFQSKVGIAVTLAFLALIAFAFASADVSSSGTFGGISGGDRVAVVGDDKISNIDLRRAAGNAVDGIRQQNPSITMEDFIAEGGLEQVLDRLISQSAVTGFAEKYGLRAGTNLVNSEIMTIPIFRGADGNFDQEAYLQAVTQRGTTDAAVRADLRAGILDQQIMIPATFGTSAPDKFAAQYASLMKETRQGAIATIPATAFLPEEDPTDAQLTAYYEENQAVFTKPERREIRYLSFDDKALGNRAAPTDAEIAANYEENKELYAASELRTVTQMIVSTKAAADAISNAVKAGGSLETSAREAGLQTAQLGPVSQSDYAEQTSAGVAKAVFEASNGAVTVPSARGDLGFYVVRVDKVSRNAGKTLAQARAEITTNLAEQKRQTALADLSAEIEEKVDKGTALSELASELNVKVETTKPVTANGAVYENPSETVPQILGPALQTAFAMEESKPQLAAVVPGQTFLVYEVSKITQSAAPPLDDIRENAVLGWSLTEGANAAKAAADRILKRISEGSTLNAAISAEEATLPPANPVNLSREELARSGQQVPAPLALLFGMAQDSTKKLEGPQNAGWFIVRLDKIQTGTIGKDDPEFADTKRDIGDALRREFADQLRSAIQAEMGEERNDAAIEAVRKQLTGVN